jgi:hypothetical protein
MNKNAAFTIVAKNYIGLAKILEKSIYEYNPEIVFYIIVADEPIDNISTENISSNILFAKDILNISDSIWTEMSFKYDLTEFCTAIKPFAFNYLLNEINIEKVIYFDPDILVFSTFSFLFEILDSYSIIITPHITEIHKFYKGDRSETGLLSTGVFNLGFCALKSNQTCKNMLQWWEERLIHDCFIDNDNSLFTDQKWIDFLPCIIDQKDLYVSRHLGLNFAPWNYFERKIIPTNNNKFEVVSRNNLIDFKSYPLVFVHYSGYDYKKIIEGTIIQNNIADIKKYEDVELILDLYRTYIINNLELFNKFINLQYSYNFYENGDIVLNFHRRIYRSFLAKNKKFEMPFNIGNGTLHNKFLKTGMIDNRLVSFNKVSKNNLNNIKSKLKIFNIISLLIFKLIGFRNYLLILKLFKPFSRTESQLHLIDKVFIDNNIY